jgi:hypothetical protein
MKRLLLQYLLLIVPIFAFAQSNPPVYKDLTGKIKKIVHSFKLTDHASVIQTNVDDENFELIAINDKMEVLWRTTLKGFAIGAGKFKGQILAVAATGFSQAKGIISPYNGFLINGQTGKLIQQKVIYNSSYDTKEWAKAFFTENDANFSLVIGQTDNNKSIPMFEVSHVDTKDLTVINLNEKLEAINTKHIVPNGGFVGIADNNKNELFVFVIQDDKTLKVSKYEASKTESSGTVIQNIDLNRKSDIEYGNPNGKPNIESDAWAFASSNDQNIAYFASVHKNYDKDRELTVCKLDFTTRTSQIVNEVLDGKHIRSIEKNYSPFDKKLDKPDVGGGSYMAVRYMEEYNGTLLVTFSEHYIASIGKGGFFKEYSLIINGYDLNLKQKFQQILPSLSESTPHLLYTGYHFINNALYVIANTGERKRSTFYGQLDLSTGNWLKLEILPRKGIENYEYSDKNVLWFTNGFIVPYMAPHGLIMGKEIASLQLSTY